MLIQIRVAAAQARAATKALEGDVTQLAAKARAANAASAQIGAGGVNNLTRFGSRAQWAGRQLTYNFTLPLALAAGAATKWQLANEKAMVKVAKVYGDVNAPAATLTAELTALGKAFEQLSNKYGVQQAEVLDVAAAWAAAGVSGVALAKSVDLTMQAMILGEMDATKATQALIAIQAQYGASTEELNTILAELNMIENQTGISLEGLIDGFTRAAGVARTAGVSSRELGAMLAALTPAAGSAAQAGNALKTIFSRLVAPTSQASDVMAAMGINTGDLAWKTSNATQRLQIMAAKFADLSTDQKGFVSSIVASRYQVNRFSVLMKELAPGSMGYFTKAMESTASQVDIFKQKQKELNMVLDSQPQKLKQIYTILQNTMANIIQPLIPLILDLAAAITKVVIWFSNLNPYVQKAVGIFLLLTATFGIVLRYLGAAAVAIGYLSILWKDLGIWIGIATEALWRFIKVRFILLMRAWSAATALFGGVFTSVFALLPAVVRTAIAAIATSPVTAVAAVIAGILAVFFLFRDQIHEIFNNLVQYFTHLPSEMANKFTPFVNYFWHAVDFIKRAFYSLPEAVQAAFKAVLQVISASAQAVYNLFSYLNPFAHHSPSLVENTEGGMSRVADAHKSASGSIQQHIGAAHSATSAFAGATSGFRREQQATETAAQRAAVGSVAPNALPQFDRMIKTLRVLQADLAKVTALVSRQQAVVDSWKAKLDAANNKLNVQAAILSHLQKIQQDWADKLSAAKDALSTWADTPIQGMREMSDQIFDNQQAQKALQLQMMEMEDVGDTIQNVTDKLAALNGEQEVLSGTIADLRAAGAGSDILGPLQAQLDALEDQKQAYKSQIGPLQDLQTQLDELARQGQKLDLQNSLQFDGLTRQIDQAANAMQEMPFDVILAGVQSSQVAISELTAKYDEATAAVVVQQAVVDQLTAARDAIQARYDAESAKLDKLKNQYDQINDAIQAITDSLADMQAAADKASSSAAAKAANRTAAQFAGGAGGNVPDVGGSGTAIRTDWKSQAADIDAFTQGIADDVAAMFGQFDLFAPIKEKWHQFQDWWTSTVTPAWNVIWDGMKQSVVGVDFKSALEPVGGMLQTLGEKVQPFWQFLQDVGRKIPEIFGEDLKNFVSAFFGGISDMWNRIRPQLQGFIDLWPSIAQTISNVWTIIQPILKLIVGAIIGIGSILLHILTNTIRPALDMIGAVIGGALQIILGVFEIFFGILTLNWSQVWEGIKDVFLGIWQGIFVAIGLALAAIWGAIAGIVQKIWDIFVWLYEQLVGHSIIPDMVNAILFWFQFMWKMIQPIWEAFKAAIKVVATVVKWLWNEIIQPAFTGIVNAIKLAWNLISPVIELLKGAFSSVGGKVKDIWDTVTTKFTDIVEFIKKLPGKISSAASGMWDGIKNAFKSVINAIIGWWNGLEFKIPGIDKGPIHIGGFTLGVPDIPYLARGGLTSGTSIAGEGRYPEYVIPLDPSMRNRAFGLLAAAALALGNGGVSGAGGGLKSGGAATHSAALRRLGIASSTGTVAVMDRSTTELHFHGDLVFPSVKSEKDAKTFIDNLNDLAKGA